MMQFDLDFWEIIRPLLPVFNELERIEDIAAGKTAENKDATDGQSQKDEQRSENREKHNDGMEER